MGVWALGGLHRLNLVVETLSAGAAQCGVTKDLLETSLRFIIGQSRIIIVGEGEPRDAYIYLQVTMLGRPICAANVYLGVSTFVTVNLTNHVTYARVWDANTVRTGGDAPRGVSDDVEQLAKQLVNDWSAANASQQ